MLYKVRRKLLSQNFLYNRRLINLLVRNSSIGLNDTVVEIGSGKGFITSELLKVAKKIIAIELDGKLFLHLKEFLNNYNNLEIYHVDFLKFLLPKFPYKVFANIPFAIEGEIVRKLLNSIPPPEDCYLIVDKRFALRLSGTPRDNQFSLKHKPWFDFSISYNFKRSDFIPTPRINAVLWRINKKEIHLIPWEEKEKYQKFVEVTFGKGQPVKNNLRKMFSKEQIEKLSTNLSFSLKLKPSFLSFEQWLQLYRSVELLAP